ncbi:MAG: DNA gyrase/topoisomerase IV subunit A [Bacteroidales bacterium]|nr:DNA gyrase/topoisomerase IV subunit A [Bacteroidales bacterium]MEE3406688.1 DNA gyrase/topoisomerase IV subunit A [Candidatus Cryptobacteroides sp.]SKC48573.1 DNA topoisomerase IV subunit A [Bacteroidales bacterium WCE2008]MBQ1856844.1 DNA gyrase/topoisomerase IV subunit A [Bacteroidales bacterium]MBQ3917817.1 DNA gyrase/topoisomerase IV subunit A [Bacteroidales bacterium]
MAEEWDDIQQDDDLNEAPLDDSTEGSGKFDRLLGEDSRKYKLSGMFKDWFLDYSSYVILQRAVPHIVDGLKPVQRRVLHAMYRMDDGAYTKVANIVGQAMQFHPHGDQSILGALVQLGQKGYAVDCQGNWGNILTGDSNAAPRYIEARLSKFAKEVIFDPKITNWMTSYDGRNQEPTELPVRFPLLLAQGTEGIAVGMASKILPHNFNELIDGSIAILKGQDYEIYPDFPTGGFADCSKYMDGKRGGTVKVRAQIDKLDKNTIAITALPYGKTTHVLIDSILKAKDKGKIKIKKIEDMTTDKVEIIIHLPNDVSPDKTIDALYAFTDCEATIAPNTCVIKDNKPQFLSVKDVLEYDTWHTRDLLGAQLQIKLEELENDWHYSSLERIFFENKVYKILEENQKTWEIQLDEVFSKMKEYQGEVRREIVMDDILKLVEKPVRKISKFDTKAMDEKIRSLEEQMADIKDKIEHLTEYTIDWFKGLKKKYGKDFPRLTEITSFETIAATKVVNNNAKLYANLAEGFVGIGLKKDDNGEYISDCSDLSEIVVISKDGKYRVTKVSDKAFFGKNLLYVGVFNRGDERTIYNVIYRDGKSSIYYAKRFSITSVTRDKEYDITQGKPGSDIIWFTVNHNGEAETVRINFRPKPKLKKSSMEYDFSTLAIKGKASRGNLVSKNAIQKIVLKAKGVSTISGKDIWYDEDVQRLNEDSRGRYLGQFDSDDKVLAIFSNGTYYTTSFDLSNRYQGDVLAIEKLDPSKTYTALYWDGAAKAFYVKRFSFTVSDNTSVSFISDAKGSYLVAISEDKHPQILVTFGGKYEHREAEAIDAEEFIAKKGLAAKGKKCHQYDLKKVEFIEPLVKEDDEPEEEIQEDVQEEIPDDVLEVNETEMPSAAPAADSGAKAGDVIDLGEDDIPDDEPTLFDL